MFNLFKEIKKDNKKDFLNWLNGITNRPSGNIQAYWFGLFESEKGYVIYLTGSNNYDEVDDDWACNIDFTPENKYLDLGLKGYKWEDVLDIATNLIKDFTKSEEYKKHFISKADHIAVGFDDGDLIKIK